MVQNANSKLVNVKSIQLSDFYTWPDRYSNYKSSHHLNRPYDINNIRKIDV